MLIGMNLNLWKIMVAIMLAGMPLLHAGGKKDDDVRISFHLEGDRTDNPKMIFPHTIGGQKRAFKRVPEITSKDLKEFNAFASRSGEGFGLLLKFERIAANRLASITAANQGKWLVAQVNGLVVDGVMIDRQINDGQLVIYKNIPLTVVQAMDKEFPRLGKKKPRD